MHVRSLFSAAALTSLLAVFSPGQLKGQGVVTIPRPRAVSQARVAEAIEDSTKGRVLSSAERAGIVARQVEQAKEWVRAWSIYKDENEAALFWASDTVEILPAAALSPGSDEAAIYTELAAALSGGWRFAVGTTLAVSTGDDEEDEPSEQNPAAQQETEEPDTDAAFQKFTAGGGNISLAAMRPVAVRNGNFSSHLVFVVPRIWANIPSLSDADDVNNFGGEFTVEYQYQRYARQMKADATLEEMPEAPFLTFQVRGGFVSGTNAFYRSIGRVEEKFFPYVAPTLHLVFQEKVKLGVTYFLGPNDFQEHQNLRINFALVPSRKAEQPQAATTPREQ